MFFSVLSTNYELKTLCNLDIIKNPKLLLKFVIIKKNVYLFNISLIYLLMMNIDTKRIMRIYNKNNFYIKIKIDYKNIYNFLIFPIINLKIKIWENNIIKISQEYINYYKKLLNTDITEDEIIHIKDKINEFETFKQRIENEDYYEFLYDQSESIVFMIYTVIFINIFCYSSITILLFLIFKSDFNMKKNSILEQFKIIGMIIVLLFDVYFISFIFINLNEHGYFSTVFFYPLAYVTNKSIGGFELHQYENIILQKFVKDSNGENFKYINNIEKFLFLIIFSISFLYFGNRLLYSYRRYFLYFSLFIFSIFILSTDLMTSLIPFLGLFPEYRIAEG